MEEQEGPSALEALLANSAAQGTSDSVGSFTINFEAARDKLAKFQLPDPSSYLLKLLQAAVWGGASAVSLVIGSRESVFDVGGWQPDANAITDRMCQPELAAGKDPVDSLVIALRALLAQKAVIALQFPARDRDNVLLISETLEWRTLYEEVRSFSVTVNFPAGAARSRKDDLRLLKERCYGYPLPLSVNGKLFIDNEPYWGVETELGHHFPGSTVLASAKSKNAKHVFVRASLETEARISILRGGVVTDVVRRNLNLPGLDILADGEELETDLTGLQIRQNAKLDSLLSSMDFSVDDLKDRARHQVMSVHLSSVPPKLGHINSGLGCVGGLAFLYGLIRMQVYLIMNFGEKAGLIGVILALPLFYYAFINLDKLGFRVAQAPDGLRERLIAAMLEKLK